MLSDEPIRPGDLVTQRNPPVACAVGRVVRMQTVKVKDTPVEYLLVDFGGPRPVTRESAAYARFVPWHERPRGLRR